MGIAAPLNCRIKKLHPLWDGVFLLLACTFSNFFRCLTGLANLVSSRVGYGFK